MNKKLNCRFFFPTMIVSIINLIFALIWLVLSLEQKYETIGKLFDYTLVIVNILILIPLLIFLFQYKKERKGYLFLILSFLFSCLFSIVIIVKSFYKIETLGSSRDLLLLTQLVIAYIGLFNNIVILIFNIVIFIFSILKFKSEAMKIITLIFSICISVEYSMFILILLNVSQDLTYLISLFTLLTYLFRMIFVYVNDFNKFNFKSQRKYEKLEMKEEENNHVIIELDSTNPKVIDLYHLYEQGKIDDKDYLFLKGIAEQSENDK